MPNPPSTSERFSRGDLNHGELNHSEPQLPEDPVLVGARREAVFVICMWVICITYAVGYCSMYGYGPGELRFILGFPDWIFGGIVVPWFICLVISVWFAFRFMRDDPLDEALEDLRPPESLDA